MKTVPCLKSLKSMPVSRDETSVARLDCGPARTMESVLSPMPVHCAPEAPATEEELPVIRLDPADALTDD